MISVVIPLYNKEKSIAKTLESVLAQTYMDWECIIVNDGSTDKSAEVVERLTINDERFRLIDKENGGVSSARNRGIMEAKGEYVAFLDGDDLWDSRYLGTLVKLIQEYPRKGLYGVGCVAIYGDAIPRSDKKQKYYRGEITTWSYDCAAWTGSSVAAAAAALKSVGLFDERLSYGEDKDMWFRLQLLAGAACDFTPLAFYRQDSENRAMHRIVPLEKHLAYFWHKFDAARLENVEFRRFFDAEMIQTLYPYLLNPTYKNEARRLLKGFDYTLQKNSMRFRVLFPYLYKWIKELKK